MVEPLHIEQASMQDIPAIVQLVNSAYRGDNARKGWTHEADLISGTIRIDASSIEAIIQNKDAVILKCMNAKQTLIGSVYLEKQGNKLYLGMLSVLPDIQAQGVGRRLLKAADSYASEMNCTSIVMTVISDRTELINWYERNGYTSTGERQPFPDDGKFGIPNKPLEFIVLEKQISKMG